ncbi:MAG: hypothetical protein AAF267_02670 [Deinococcota bacterium]
MRGKRSTAGIAIITAISFMVVTLAFISTAFIVSISNTRLSGDQVSTTRAQLAAQAGIDEAILRIWHEASENINRTGSISGRRDIPDYRARWENVRNWSSYDNWGGANRLLSGGLDADDNSTFGDPVTFTGEVDDGTGRIASYEVSIERRDEIEIDPVDGTEIVTDRTTLRITSTGTLPNGSQRRVQQELEVAYPQFNLEFAFLTDFVNCTFCHSAFTSIEMGYDRDEGMGEDFEFLVDLTNEDAREAAAEGKSRIRVAGLNDMQISTGWKNLNTLVAGTIYTRGPQNIMRTDGTGGGTRPKQNVFGPVYREGTGLIADEDWEGFRPAQADNKDLLLSCIKNANDGNAGCDKRNARFYEFYPTLVEGQATPIDGEVPDVQQFPSPIVDQNGDRRIDNDEWAAVMDGKAIGSLEGAAEIWFSPTDDNGVPDGTNTVTLPFEVRGRDVTIPGMQTDIETQPGRGIAGNLFLIGTDDDPIEIEGTVYVDGDLVIQGPIDPGNRGVFIVRKNIYIVGDVIYDCNGTADGTGCRYYEPNSLPRFAMVAGGMMVMGDPNQGSTTRGFPGGFNERWQYRGDRAKDDDRFNGRFPLQGELLAFNAKQFEKYVESQDAGATTLEEIFVPRYYMYREGDEIVMRCNFDGEDTRLDNDRRGTSECRDFQSHYGTADELSPRENIPCIAGQIDIFGQNDENNIFKAANQQPNCMSAYLDTDGDGDPDTTFIGLDTSGDGNFVPDANGNEVLDAGEDLVIRIMGEPIADDPYYQAFRAMNNTDSNLPWFWDREPFASAGGIPVQQFVQGDAAPEDFALLADEIFVTDRSGNRIQDGDGDDLQPAYIYMSPNNSWLAPVDDLNGNSVPDNVDLALEPMDKVYSRQNAIAAMEVLSGAWIEYGLNNDRSQNDQRPMRIDGLLFTNNAIQSYLPARSRRSHTAGGLILNGSIISYETGLLIYGTGSGPDGSNNCAHGQNRDMFDANNYLCVGLRVQYDRRLPGLLDLRVDVPVLLRSRSQWLPVN